MKLAFVAVVAILILAGCKKDITINEESINAETIASDVAGEFPNCKLRRIVHKYGGDPFSVTVNALLTYNSAGNPISMVYPDEQNGTGNPNHYFIYDSQKRLSEWQLKYGPFIVEHHYYKHNAANQIVYDSAIHREAGAFVIIVSAIEYDAAGRVVKETKRNVFNQDGPLIPTRRPTYTYDSRGNIGVLNWRSSWYDNKVSLLRSHPVFQFLMKNYSRNNPYNSNSTGQKYNSLGLPLSIKAGNDRFFNAFNIEKLIYDCQ